MDKARVETFSDGVFAVAITLLVLDLRVPGPGHGSLLTHLRGQWPEYAAYVVSFLVIGIIWVNHHALMGRLAVVDRTLLFLNLLLLLFVVGIPFPTSVVAQYLLHHGRWDAKVAVAFYSVVMEAMGLSFTAIYLWAGRHPALLSEAVAVLGYKAAFRQFAFGSIAYLLLIAVSFISPEVALAGHFALAVFYVFDRTAVTGEAPA